MNQTIDPVKTNKLVIRIKVAQESESSSSNNLTNILPIGVWLIIAVVFASLIGGWYWYSNQDNSISELSTSSPGDSKVVTAEVPLANEITAQSQPIISLQPEVPAVVADEKPEVKEVVHAPVVAEKSEPFSQKAEVKIEPADPLLVFLKSASPVAESIEQESEAITSAPSVELESKSKNTPTAKQVTADNVTRALFALEIKNREPVNVINDKIAAKAEGLKRVYFFSELSGMKGKKILHRWIHNGKKQTDVAFDVKGNRWRIYSSKRIIPARTGEWQVDIIDKESQQILASKIFTYGNK